MKESNINLIMGIISGLEKQQDLLFEMGHSFWHCDASDTNNKGEYKPFRYYQTNRNVNMSTCSTCHRLMETRKEIRKWQKTAGLPLTPLVTNETSEKPMVRMHVTDNRICNPNFNYAFNGRY